MIFTKLKNEYIETAYLCMERAVRTQSAVLDFDEDYPDNYMQLAKNYNLVEKMVEEMEKIFTKNNLLMYMDFYIKAFKIDLQYQVDMDNLQKSQAKVIEGVEEILAESVAKIEKEFAVAHKGAVKTFN